MLATIHTFSADYPVHTAHKNRPAIPNSFSDHSDQITQQQNPDVITRERERLTALLSLGPQICPAGAVAVAL